MYRALIASLLLLSFAPDAEAVSSRARQLMEAMEKQAENNAWDGVESQYKRLLEMDEALPANGHLLGARSAASNGHAQDQWDRLQLALASEDGTIAQSAADAFSAAYAAVEIKGKPAWHAKLAIQSRPFAPDQAAAYDYAARRLEGAGSFRGMLPIGQYCLGTQTFELAAGGEPLVVKLTGKDLKACSAW